MKAVLIQFEDSEDYFTRVIVDRTYYLRVLEGVIPVLYILSPGHNDINECI
jgi:hypothetical protein